MDAAMFGPVTGKLSTPRQRLIDQAVRKVMQHMRIGPRGLVHGDRFTINVQREFLRLSRSPQG